MTETDQPATPPAEPAHGDRKGARERILAAATDLFYREGVRAVGIDAVIEQAGVAKMSLYRAFPSKDDLVAAFLAERDERYWDWWNAVLARHPGDPRAQIRDLFADLARRTSNPAFRGCAFINVAVEFPAPDHPGRAVAVANKRELRRRLGELTSGLGVADPARLADQLFLVMEGAYCAGGMMGPEGPVAQAAAAAESLIQAALS